MSKKKKDYLFERIISLFKEFPNKGKVLDLGCGNGHYGFSIKEFGFDVTAADMDDERFEYHDKISFQSCHLNQRLPFEDNIFDYVIFLEVIEHLENPFEVIGEISRILKPGGTLILSTPNILNIRSRLRFVFEGSFDFFREPTLDYAKVFPIQLQNMHIVVWRYQELEYMLSTRKLDVKAVHADYIVKSLYPPFILLAPFLYIHNYMRMRRIKKKGGVDIKRMNKVLFSKEMLFGRHVILEAKKS